ncbi:toll-like receptor 8 [Bufo gargarizans]|uniref:toll-like receptor 8 n=1 Tax=Bufo gargarizans TaxID=30331 RepID=UPI001CF54994|nr:toll-like receptor 8 [Bufo gargarizans]XP_044140712.1 toll-like receptor 8 [Bufo gargarizans]XP_044140713.1 toll-like receptor 8 [Bufo gargarizans]
MLNYLRNTYIKLVIMACFLGVGSSLPTNKTIPCSITEQNNSVVFDCSARSLKTVPHPSDYNSKSVELLLKQNLIQNIDQSSFQEWRNLTKIDMSVNHYPKSRLDNVNKCKRGLEIRNGTFSNLTKLEQLIIDSNYLCEIPPGLPDSISMLSFQYNYIFSINRTSFSSIKHLRKLNLGRNCYYGNKCPGKLDIENGTFTDLKELNVLNLSFNNITSVPQDLPSSLKELHLSNNRIKVIHRDDFKNLVNLEILYLSGNCPRCYNAPYPCYECPGKSSIEIDEFAFQNLANLSILHLGSTSLSSIPKTWFQNTTRLKILNLALNYLVTEISTGEFFRYLPSLEVINLNFNYNFRSYPKNINISENFSKLVSLRELYIRGYVFKDITAKNLAPLTKLKKLTILDLGINFIRNVDFNLFKNFPSLSILYLSENRISPFSEISNKSNTIETFYSSFSKPIQSQFSLLLWYDTETSQAIITPETQLVKPQCSKYGKTLDLSLNSIFFIDPEEFRAFSDIACLNFSSNGIGQDLNGSEFIYFPNLAYLDLSYNKLDFASFGAFQELKQLEVLDLSYNEHYFIVEGVTHHLHFIENLHKLTILNLSSNQISTLTEPEIKSNSLKELRFAGNRLDVLWGKGDTRYLNLFKQCANLSLLDISHNKILIMPDEALINLPTNLSELYLNQNELQFFDWKNLRYFKNLKILDLSHNRLTMIIAHLSNYTQSLQTLIISHNSIQTLADGFLLKAVSLTHLDLSFNLIQSINKSIFLSGNDNYLKVLKLKGNPFDCTCEIIDLVQWIIKNNVTIPRLVTDVTCATPNNWKKKGIITFDIQTCNVDMIAMLLFLTSSLVIVPLTALPVVKHLFYWDVWYIYHWCKARFKRFKVCSSGSVYDAFITYDETDPAVTDWVYNELCHQIEDKGNKSILLCLEERDWEPGKAVIDNIAQSINQSKKTLFVLTKKYIRRGKFRTAFYLAMQKLMDENMDVIVIVLLQPVLQNSQYLRLRKKICKSSILEWPKNPKAKPLFWQKMKNVLLTENYTRYNNMYTDYIAM